jgi:hypothetical protein
MLAAMGFRLTAEAGDELKLNSWQWKPIVTLAGRTGAVDDGTVELMNFNADVPLTAAQAERLAAAVDEVVAAMPDGSRLLLDGGVSTEPDDGTFHRDDLSLNYSTPKTSLQTFATFSRTSHGFRIT